MRTLIWLSDLHLDEVAEEKRRKFYDRLSKATGKAVVITGDISNGRQLCSHLLELGEACGSKPVYFVLGNHDFYWSSFARLHGEVGLLCNKQKNLHHLGHGEVIELDRETALIGHDGWADGRAGYGVSSRAKNPDFWSIGEFQSRRWKDCYGLMNSLGRESGRYLERRLPAALRKYRRLIVATHVPPFTQAARWNGKICNYHYQPHYTNLSMGYTLWQAAERFPKKSFTVLAGHTHSEVALSMKPNLQVRTAGVAPGDPRYELIDVAEAA